MFSLNYIIYISEKKSQSLIFLNIYKTIIIKKKKKVKERKKRKKERKSGLCRIRVFPNTRKLDL